MANGGKIEFGIGFKVDESGLTKIKQQLQELSTMSITSIQKANPTLSMNEANGVLIKIRQSVAEVQQAMTSAFDTTTGVMNLQQFNANLKKLDFGKIQSSFSQAGTIGQEAFLGISKAALTTNVQLKQTSGILDKMGTTFTNTIKWGISSKIMNSFTGAVQQAWGYVQHLDTSLNDIRIVTGKSAEEMDKFAEKANNAAKALGTSTTEYTEAALIYYQQGLSDEETNARAETTLKAANVTGQSAQEVSEQLTAVWNGYKVSAEETELYVDKLAATAAITAADLEELSTGMSKVASAAANMGVDIDQLNAQLATIISVTRQAPESAGTALKTIYARIEDLKLGGEDEDGTKLGDVSGGLASMGINIKDSEGDLRDLGEVIEEVAQKWDTWTDSQQTAIAQLMAGKRQYNNLLALFDNWSMYESALETSKNSVGTLQTQQDIFMESTEAHLQQLKTQWEDLYDSLLDTQDINKVVDGLTNILDKITDIVDVAGGLKGLFSGIVGLIGTTFSKQIANAFSPMISNMSAAKQNAQVLEQLLANINYQAKTGAISGQAAAEMTKAQQTMSNYWSVMSEEEINASNQTVREIGDWASRKEAIEETTVAMKNYFAQYGDKKAKSIVGNKADGTEKTAIDFSASDSSTQYLIKRLEKVNGYLTTSKTCINDINKLLIRLPNGIKPTDAQLNQIEAKVKGINGTLTKVHKQGIIDDSQFVQAQNALTKIQQEINEIRNPKSNKTSFSSDVTLEIEKLSNITGIGKQELEQLFNTLRNGKADVEECTSSMDRLNEILNLQELRTRQVIQATSQLIGSFSTLYFAIQTISNIGSVFTDDELDGMEKFQKILTALLMGLPMVISGLSSLSTALQTLTHTQSLNAAVTAIGQKAMGLFGVSAGGAIPSVTGLTGAIEGLNAAIDSIPIIGWILAGVTAAITATVAVVKAYQQHLENVASAAKEYASTQKELLENEQAEKEKIDELVDSYQEYLDILKEKGELTEEEQSGVFDLVSAYGDQDLIIQALAGDYEKLAASIREKQAAEAEDYKRTAKATLTANETALTSNIIANASKSERDDAGFDLSGMGGTDQHNTFRNDLQSTFGISVDSSGHMSWDDLNTLLTSDIKDLQDFLKRHEEDSSKAVQQIRQLYADNKETIETIKEDRQVFLDETLEVLGNSFSEDIANVENIFDYQKLFDNLVQQAQEEYKKEGYNKKDAREQGEQWARSFLDGQGQEFKDYNTSSTLQDSILDIILPNDEVDHRIQSIKDKLTELQASGNVDLLNRPIVTDEDFKKAYGLGENDYATVDTHTYGNDEVGYINLTPIIVNENGEYQGFYTEEKLAEYANGILSGTQKDVDNLVIGVYTNEEDAKKSAEQIHFLHEELVAAQQGVEDYSVLISDILGEKISAMSEAQKTVLAGNLTILHAMIENGYSVQEVLDSLQEDLDAAEHEEHVVKIQAVLDASDSKIEEKLQELFADETLEIPVTLEQYNAMDEADQQMLLLNLQTKELETKYDISDAQKEINKEKIKELEIAKQTLATHIEDVEKEKDIADAQTKSNINKILGGKQNQFGETYDDFDTVAGSVFAGTPDKDLQELKQRYIEVMTEVGAAYEEAVGAGDNGLTAAQEKFQELADKDIVEYQETLNAINSRQEGISNEESFEELADQWAKNTKSSREYEEQLEGLEKQQSKYNDELKELKDLDPANYDWSQALENTAEALESANDSIDELQTAYQSLQSIVTDYNEDGSLQLDNLQTLMEMSDEYVASLELQNGQLIINNETFDNAVDIKLNYLKTLAATQLYQTLMQITQDQLTDSTQTAAEAEFYQAAILGDLSDAAIEAKDKLLELDLVQEAMGKNAEATQTALDAYYNKLQMIDNLDLQSTDSQLKSYSSSSSSSSSDPDTKDHLKNEYDLYEGINSELEKMESILGRIENIDEHSWGASAIEAINEETELLEDELELYEQKASIQQQDLAKQKVSLESQGITFSEDGSAVSNAKEKLDTLYAEYNAMVDKYNAMSKSEQDDYEDTLDKKKDAIDDLEDAIDDYESLYSDYQDTLDTIQDKEYELISKEVEKFNYTVDIHLELNDAKQEWNDFWYDVIKDVDNTDFGDLEDKLSSLSGKIEKSLSNLTTLVGFGTKDNSSSEIGELTKHLNDTTAEVWKQINSAGADGIFKNDSALSKENLTDYRDKLISAMTEAKNALDDISESYLGMLDAAQDKIDEHVDGLNAVGDQINHNIKLIQLRKWDLSDSKRSDALNRQYEQQYKNNQRLLNTNKQSVDFWKDEISNYTKLLNKTKEGTEEYKTYTQAMEKATENYRDAVDDLNKSLEQSLEDLQNWYENEVAIIQKTLDDSLSNGLGLDTVEEEWNLINEYSEKYLDNVERALELESYTNDLNDAADAIGLSAENQAKLNKFREDELKKLNAKTKLTQYDIDESRARLEIMKQEMALEDQRNNKSKMRLRRDNQGNYNYQYVGDQDAEDKAERGLLTAKKEWYELVKKRWKETTDYTLTLSKQQITLQEEYEQALANKQLERAKKLEDLMKRNAEELTQTYAEAEKNKQDLYNGTAQYFADVQNAKILPTNNTTIRNMIDSWAGSNDKTSFTAAVKKAMDDLNAKVDEFKSKQSALVKESGTAWGSVRDKGIDPTKESLDKLVDSEDELKDGLEKTNDELKVQETNLKNAEAAYESFKDSVVAAVKAANDALETLSKTTLKVKDDVSSVSDAAGSSNDNSNSTSSASNDTSSSSNTGDSGGNNTGSNKVYPYEAVQDPYGVHENPPVYGIRRRGSSQYLIIDTKENLKKKGYNGDNVKGIGFAYYRSGGYTGEWADDSGKLAVLHQKELVLNESDTSNLLKAVDSVRELVANNSSIDVSSIAAGLVQTGAIQAQMLAQVGQGLLSAMSSVVTTNNQSYNNNMTVNADFSGVRSADAIYQALRELENYGAQQAYSISPFANKAY